MPADPVGDIVRHKKAVRAADRILAMEELEGGLVLSNKRMGSWIKEPDEPIDWRINGLHEVGDNTTLAAAYKTGKSTMFVNLIRSLADGVPFLGECEVKPVTGSIYYWNLEVGEKRMKRWLRRLQIDNHDRVVPENLRGKRVELANPLFQELLIEHLKSIECEVWLIDPMGRILSSWPGFNGRENNNDVMREVGETLDRIKEEAGVQDMFVATHTGRAGEHTRGATVTDDWPDSLWHMTKRKVIEDEPQIRFFWIEGRDTELEEVGLGFDKENGRTWMEHNLAGLQLIGHAQQVLRALAVNGPQNSTGMKAVLKGVDTNKKPQAVQAAVERGYITIESGQGGAKMHRLNHDNPEVQKMYLEITGKAL